MKRIKSVLATLVVVAATFAAGSSPAMADDLDCRNAWGSWIRCDGQYYAPVDDGWWGDGWWGDGWKNVHDVFQENCIGVTSGGECIGIGPDLDYYTNGYYSEY